VRGEPREEAPVEQLIRDMAYGLRLFVRSPGFAVVAVLSLALGIGANVTVFALMNALFLRPVAVADPGRLVLVHTVSTQGPGYFPVSFPNYEDYRDGSSVWSGLAAYQPVAVSLAGGGEPVQVDAGLVSGNFFDVLGVEAALGRTFSPEESRTESGPPVVVLSDALWRSRFGADPGEIGKTLLINGLGFTVIGVAPAAFTGVGRLESQKLWVPLSAHGQILPSIYRPFFTLRRPLLFLPVGRLKEGVSLERAQAEMGALAARLARDFPDANRGRSLALIPLDRATISANEQGPFLAAGSLLLALVALVLLIACANVAGMQLARASGRRREMAVRLAVGATRGRLVRQLLAESLVLALVAGGVGVLLAVWARRALLGFENPILPATLEVPLDVRVLLFAFGVSLLAAFVFGLAPALQASRSAPIAALRGDFDAAAAGFRRFGLRSVLVAGQVALSTVCLVGTALFLWSLHNALKIDPGFTTDDLLAVTFDLDGQGLGPEEGRQLVRRIVERVEALPGVRSAAVAASLPLDPDAPRLMRTAVLEGGGKTVEESPIVQMNTVGMGYFDTLGIPVLAGRAFTEEDRQGGRAVVVVNRTMAEKLWPGESPVGRRMTFLPENEVVEVAGVARDAKVNSLGEETPLYVYRPLAQSWAARLTLHVRTTGRPELVLEPVLRTLRTLAPGVPLLRPSTFPQVLGRQLALPRLGAVLLAFFGGAALLLTLVGLAGLVAFSVSQRVKEIGLRMALGARRGQVVALFLREVLVVFACGLAIGLAGAYALSRSLAGLLYGIDAGDPTALVATALLLTAAALAASWWPVRKAAAVEPVLLLRR